MRAKRLKPGEKNEKLQKARMGNTNAMKDINWDLIDDLLSIGCTSDEICHVVGIDTDTLTNRCKKDKGMLFSEYLKKGNQKFKESLRRAQTRSALNGSVPMQIWLGKQFLNQKDRHDLEIGETRPIEFNMEGDEPN